MVCISCLNRREGNNFVGGDQEDTVAKRTYKRMERMIMEEFE